MGMRLKSMGIGKLLYSSHSRTALIKKNIAGSFVIKGVSVLASVLLVPLTIHYVDQERYGLWLTIASIVGWISFFDIGFGNGLRNKLAESKANNDYSLCKAYVSTTYFFIALISFVLLIAFNFCIPYIDWTGLLNVSSGLDHELKVIIHIVFSLFCIQFVLKIISTIIIAYQEPAKAALIDMVAQVVSLVSIFFLAKFADSSLFYLSLCYSLSPVLVLAAASLYFFRGKFRMIAPSFKCIDVGIARDILSLGLKFFVLQIAVVVIYQVTNVIISNVVGPVAVTEYNIAYKYFSVSFMFFSIIITPFWSAFTDAYTQNDYPWMVRIYHKLYRLTVVIMVGIVFMQLVSPFVYRLWVGKTVTVSYWVSFWISIFMMLNVWNNLHAFIINGIGKVKVQLYVYLIGTAGSIPLALYLGRLWGVQGIVLASIIFSLLPAVLLKIQVSKILGRRAKGIWNK